MSNNKISISEEDTIGKHPANPTSRPVFNLRPHQLKAIEQATPILETHGVVMLAMSPRLGKTMCSLTLAEGKTLFITKKMAIPSILADSRLMGISDDRLTVLNYESLHKLTSNVFDTVILDECHAKLSAFPKMGPIAKRARGLCHGTKRVILLSGTPAIESSSQWFHIFHVTCRGPWSDYATFYRWFKDYGIPAKIRISGGQEVNCYKKVTPRVSRDVGKFAVCMTQADVGFKVASEVVEHLVDDERALELARTLDRDGLLTFGDAVVTAENPAALKQKKAMACGGTLLSEDGEVVYTGSKAKIEYLVSRLNRGKQYAVFTQYVAERAFVVDGLRDGGWNCTVDMEAFKRGEVAVFVGSIKTWSEGVDLSWIDGAMIIYSLTFSGATFVQLLDRMNNFKRVDPIKVHVLMVRGSVEPDILRVVSQKKDFNARFLDA
jgi:hypothetical protein